MGISRCQLRDGVAPLVVVWAYAAYAYLPITQTFFHHDDFHHLYDIANGGPLEFLLKMNGFHLLLAPQAVFWITRARPGADPRRDGRAGRPRRPPNRAMLFVVAVGLTRQRWLAAGCVVAWGTMPLQEGALNAYSVFYQTLSTTVVLLAVVLITRAGHAVSATWRCALLAGLSTTAASCSFGTGIAAAAVMPVVALLLIPRSQARCRMVIALVGALPVIAMLYFSVEAYNVSNFEAVRALQVAPRNVQGFLRVTALTAQLFGVGTLALVLDGLFRPSLYPGIVATLVLALTVAVVAVGVRAAAPPDRRAFLAMLLLCLAAYAMIAAGRAFIPLPLAEIALWPRYHYMATAGVVVAIGISLAALVRRFEVAAPQRRVVFTGWLIAVATAHQFAPPIDNYGNFRASVEAALTSMRAAAVAAPPGTVVYLENRRFGTGNLLPEMRILFPGWFAVHAVFAGGGDLEGRPVRFVEPDESILAPARRGRLGSRLVVGPGEARTSGALPR